MLLLRWARVSVILSWALARVLCHIAYSHRKIPRITSTKSIFHIDWSKGMHFYRKYILDRLTKFVQWVVSNGEMRIFQCFGKKHYLKHSWLKVDLISCPRLIGTRIEVKADFEASGEKEFSSLSTKKKRNILSDCLKEREQKNFSAVKLSFNKL